MREQAIGRMTTIIQENLVPQLAGYQLALDRLSQVYTRVPMQLPRFSQHLRQAAQATQHEVAQQVMDFEGMEETALPDVIEMPSWHREVNNQRRIINLLENQGTLASGVSPREARAAIEAAKQYLYGMQTELEGPDAGDQRMLGE